ncbi:MAG: L,D-transpeptidase [Verrucomicrobiota bacterium]
MTEAGRDEVGAVGEAMGSSSGTLIMRRGFFLMGMAFLVTMTSCATRYDRDHKMIVSARDQKMVVLKKGKKIREYNISTSKFGLGDQKGSYRTPLGRMQVASKHGGGSAKGTVFKARKPTGEVVKVNSPGRDPIVTRILWLRGLEAKTKNAHPRCIYIHGTPEERTIGTPASYGCIRMRSKDVIDLYRIVGVGAIVEVVPWPIKYSVAIERGEMRHPDDVLETEDLLRPVSGEGRMASSPSRVEAAPGS